MHWFSTFDMAEKDGDLVEQIVKQTDDEKGYFSTVKTVATEIIKHANFCINFDSIPTYRELLKYNNNHCFEVEDDKGKYGFPVIDKYPNSPKNLGFSIYFDGRLFNYKIILQKYADNFEKLLCYALFFAKLSATQQWYQNDLTYMEGQERVSLAAVQFFRKNLSDILKDFYTITDDYKVIQKHNIELIEVTEKLAEKEPPLRKALDFMYACDYVNALKELALLLEPKRQEYQEKIQKGNETLFDIDKFFNFVNNYGIRHNNKKQKQATEEQLKVHLDFGLSIYRLFTIYGDL